MSKALSLDLRERVVAACDAGAGTPRQVADRFEVSRAWVYKLLKQRRDAGSVAPKAPSGGRKSAVDERARENLRERVRERPDATLEELRDRLAASGGPSVSAALVGRVLRELNLPRERRRQPRRARPGGRKEGGRHPARTESLNNPLAGRESAPGGAEDRADPASAGVVQGSAS